MRGKVCLTRRPNFVFVDTPSEELTTKAFCTRCETYTQKLNRLVPRYIDGVEDEKFRECSYCGELYPIYDVKYFAEYEPKAVPTKNPFDSSNKVETLQSRRLVRDKKKIRNVDNDQEIPDFAGKKDEFLIEAQNEGAIILGIEDSYTEDE